MWGNRSIWIGGLVLLLAGLACNAAGAGETGDTAATVGAVYATITAQAEAAGLPVTATESASEVASLESVETPTGTPTVTPTPPAERTGNGTNVSAPRCALSIAIDGSDSDWNDQNAADFLVDRATFGADQWTGADDASAHVKTCWTDEALFLLAVVSDDIHVQTETGSTQWRGDEIELMFDADLQGDFYDDRWDNDDSQFGLSPGDFAELPSGAFQYEPVQRNVESLQVAAFRPIEVGGAYTLEAKVPWALLGASSAVDAKFGFCVAVSDNDQVGQASQDSLVSHCTDLTVFNPTTWVTLTLRP